MRRLRGAAYLHEVDRRAWHLLVLNNAGHVAGCAHYLQHPNTVAFHSLTVRHSALAGCDLWGQRFQRAVESELAEARSREAAYAELGGWALADEVRHPTEALRTILAFYALAQLLGDRFGISTATVPNESASILRRVGGRPLRVQGMEVPPYYDPAHGCQMEVLRLDFRAPNPRYRRWVDDFRAHLSEIPVIYSTDSPKARAMSNRST